jgi:Sulfotransferase family
MEKIASQLSAQAAPAPFIVGAPRSGTTLLRMMMDAHPQLAVPPETGFVGALAVAEHQQMARKDVFDLIANSPSWSDYHIARADFEKELSNLSDFEPASYVRCFFRLYAQRFGKSRWGDKTPTHSRHMESIARLLPEARFIHIIRDGRDVACSLRKLWFAPSRDYSKLGVYWAKTVQNARTQGVRVPHYLEVRYEDLIIRTREVLSLICEFLDLTYDPCMIRYHEHSNIRLQEHEERRRSDGSILVTKQQRLAQQRLVARPPDGSRIGAWRTVMSADDERRFVEGAAGMLKAFQYQ